MFSLNGMVKSYPKPMYVTTEKCIGVSSRGFTRAFEASKSDFIDQLDNFTFSNEEMKIRAVGRVVNLNNLIEQF